MANFDTPAGSLKLQLEIIFRKEGGFITSSSLSELKSTHLNMYKELSYLYLLSPAVFSANYRGTLRLIISNGLN